MDRNGHAWRVLDEFMESLSARRAWIEIAQGRRVPGRPLVALRKESVDRNSLYPQQRHLAKHVALRKESVDRNSGLQAYLQAVKVALRKESVDRNNIYIAAFVEVPRSLSARRAWIEIVSRPDRRVHGFGRSPQGERG